MSVTFIPREEIESKASHVLLEHNLYACPVNPAAVAKAEGIGVYSIDFADDSVSGILRKEDGRFGIYVNHEHKVNRRRYTVAHELGHYYLHRDAFEAFVDKDINLYRSKSEKGEHHDGDMEIQANMFAAALLMPESMVRMAYQNSPDISRLAKKFGVSREAIGNRIANIGKIGLW